MFEDYDHERRGPDFHRPSLAVLRCDWLVRRHALRSRVYPRVPVASSPRCVLTHWPRAVDQRDRLARPVGGQLTTPAPLPRRREFVIFCALSFAMYLFNASLSYADRLTHSNASVDPSVPLAGLALPRRRARACAIAAARHSSLSPWSRRDSLASVLSFLLKLHHRSLTIAAGSSSSAAAPCGWRAITTATRLPELLALFAFIPAASPRTDPAGEGPHGSQAKPPQSADARKSDVFFFSGTASTSCLPAMPQPKRHRRARPVGLTIRLSDGIFRYLYLGIRNTSAAAVDPARTDALPGVCSFGPSVGGDPVHPLGHECPHRHEPETLPPRPPGRPPRASRSYAHGPKRWSPITHA